MHSPRVSIGVPVYNGQKYIGATLDSLIAQTYSDIEIIVTDNCSTDATPQIVQSYVERDPRVIYLRNVTNIGPALNYNVSLAEARGEYFKWCAADDVCSPDFVEKCVAVLDADPAVVLAYPRTSIIDSTGAIVGQNQYELEFDEPNAHLRFARIMNVDHHIHGAHELYGVMRIGVLRSAGGMRTHVRGDSVLLARLLLLGRFRRIEEHLFFNRDHSDRSSRYLARQRVRAGSRLSRYLGCGPLPSAEWWDEKLRGKIVFPEWRVLGEYGRSVHDTDRMRLVERLGSYVALGVFAIWHVPKLSRDVIIGTEQIFNLLLDSLRPLAK
jgi:glycosyltransferase involved in cell wall biosynthesis